MRAAALCPSNVALAWRCSSGRLVCARPGSRTGPGGLARRYNTTTGSAAASTTPSTHMGSSAAAAAGGPSSERPRVCILGGGFGGLYTAIKLELLMWPQGKKPQITLVDQGERFIFKPLLYELLNGTAQSWEVAPTFAQLLAPYPIQFVQDKVLDVVPEQRLTDGGSAGGGVVNLASGTSLPYDWLVVALGAAADARGIPGIKEHARPFNSLGDAEFVAGRLAAFEARAAMGAQPQQQQQQGQPQGQQQATVVIVGAGYAGVELAAVVGERLQGKASVVLVTPGPTILETAPLGQRQAAEEALRSLGVTIRTNTKVTAVQKAGGSAAAAASAVTAAVETTMAAAATAAATAAAAAGAAAGGQEPILPRPQSPEAAAVEPLAVLAAAAAAATQETSANSTTTPAAVAAAGTPSSNGTTAPGTSNSNSNSSSGPSHLGEKGEADVTYTVQLEPMTWGNAAAASSSNSSSSSMQADLVLWTAGARPASSPLQPFPLDSKGQLETDATLRVLKHTRVFALGDVSRGQRGNDGTSGGSGSSGSSSGGFYPATAQVAFQQADYAAWNLWSAINGRALLPFRYQHLGDMMSLGATNAAVALPLQLPPELTTSLSSSPLGSALSLAGIRLGSGPEGLVLEGPLAQLLRRAAYLYRQPTNEQRFNVAASWIEQAVTTAARLAAELSAANSSSSGSSGSSRRY